MTGYVAPLDQRWAADQADLIQRVAVLERQMANLAAPQLVYRTVLGASASTVRLPGSGNIPQDYTDLRLVISAKSDGTGSAGYDPAYLRYNGVAAGYSWNSIYVTQGGTVSSFGQTSVSSMQCAEIWNAFWGSAGRGVAALDIPDYSATDNLKAFTGLSTAQDGGTVSIQQSYSGSLGASHTEAITSLTLVMGTGSFVAGSTFSLYAS